MRGTAGKGQKACGKGQRAKGKRKIASWTVFLLLSTLCLVPFAFCQSNWKGIDEAVVEKIASEQGREARKPLIDPGEGDLLLFAFLCAGAVGGFAAGYYWRKLVSEKPGGHKHCGS